MNNIAHHFPLTGLSSRQSSPEFSSSVYQKELSFRSQETANTDLVIQTKDGDHVTLSSNSFSQMDAYMYTSEGMVQTESGTALFSQNYREITLASGHSFSFSVTGDLSEEEIGDIEAILQGLDEVMAEMQQGDVSGAMGKALEIGTFDSVSSYTADLNFQSFYEESSAVSAATTHTLPDQQNSTVPPVEAVPVKQKSHGAKDHARIDFDTFFEKLMKHLVVKEEKSVGLAQKPINKLFQHHLDTIEKDKDKLQSTYSAIEAAMDKMDSLIEKIQEKLLENKPSTAEVE